MTGFGYGIVGCGWVAASHAWGVRALADEGVKLVAVADTDVDRARKLADDFGADSFHADYRDLLARDDVDAISVCLPDFLHKEAALAAAEAGKHVLCEKPLALDLESADEMIAAFEHRRLGLGLVMNHRYAPDNIRVRQAIVDGAIGRVLIANVLHSSALTGNDDGSSPWRGRRGLAAGGILATQAIHFLDMLFWFAGPAAAVKAWTGTQVRVDLDYEDTAALALRLRSGALATLVTTNGAPIMDDLSGTRIEIHGSEGYIVLQGDALRCYSLRDSSRLSEVSLPPPPDGAAEVFGLGHIYEIADFIHAVREGRPPPVAAVDGRHLMAVLSAAYASSQADNEIDVDDGLDAYSGHAPRQKEAQIWQ